MDKEISRYSPNLEHISVEDCCYLLMHKLDPLLSVESPYYMPYTRYVMSWKQAVPLKAVVLAQSPYPNDIYPYVAAAMSFDAELCSTKMRMRSPPTVSVLANDLSIHAKCDYDRVVQEIQNGWKMVHDGVLLVNEAVHCRYGTAESFVEGVDQCNVIVRLLRETEKYGKSTVELFAMGSAGEKMASNISSWFKSDTVKLTRRSAPNPASLSYTFTDLRHPECNMGVPSFSKALAKHVCNDVALRHTMAPKKSESELRAQTTYNLISNMMSRVEEYSQSADETAEAMQKIIETVPDGNPEFVAAMKLCTESMRNLGVKSAVLAATAHAAAQEYRSVGGGMGKAGPALAAVNPPSSVVESHGGKSSVVMSSKPLSSTPIKIGGTPRSISIAGSTASTKSATPAPKSTPISIKPTTTPAKVTMTPSKPLVIRSSRATSEASTSRQSSIAPSQQRLPARPDHEQSWVEGDDAAAMKPPTTPTRKMYTKGKPITVTRQQHTPTKKADYSITAQVKAQLSAVEAVVEAGMSGANKNLQDDDDAMSMLEDIQHDIAHGTHYNNVVKDLIPCIEADIKANPKFMLVNWAVGETGHSETYEKCRELFGF